MSTLAEVEEALPSLTAAELAEVERLARVVRARKEQARRAAGRPKVGETMDAPLHIPESALAPLTSEELKAWGL